MASYDNKFTFKGKLYEKETDGTLKRVLIEGSTVSATTVGNGFSLDDTTYSSTAEADFDFGDEDSE